MVKILGICGSPRKKSSYTALEAALAAAKAEGGVEIELVELRARKMNFCVHCNQCLRNHSTKCTVWKDDMDELYDKFYEADGVLIASPVYEMSITPQLSTFFSRFRSAWMRSVTDPDFFLKKVGGAIAVGGTRNGGQESTAATILHFYQTQGLTICGGGSGIYGGASLWNPGDGTDTMNDPIGMDMARLLGTKMAKVTKLMNPTDQ